jgi:hypothetical protein
MSCRRSKGTQRLDTGKGPVVRHNMCDSQIGCDMLTARECFMHDASLSN